MRKQQVARALFECATALKATGFTLEFERWNEYDGKGIDDLLVANIEPVILVGDEAFSAISQIASRFFDISAQPKTASRRTESSSTFPYFENHFGTFRTIINRDGEESAATLSNFTARIIEERNLDDGVETTTEFLIEGIFGGNQRLPRVNVPAKNFKSMEWVAEKWGAQAIIRAG